MTSEHMTNTYLLDRLHGQAVKNGTEYIVHGWPQSQKCILQVKDSNLGKKLTQFKFFKKSFFPLFGVLQFEHNYVQGCRGNHGPSSFWKITQLIIFQSGRGADYVRHFTAADFTRCVTPES